jgi:hypothetical protein
MITLEPTYERETISGAFGRFSDLLEKTAKETAIEERRLSKERDAKIRLALERHAKTGKIV